MWLAPVTSRYPLAAGPEPVIFQSGVRRGLALPMLVRALAARQLNEEGELT
ncbi:MAG: hypothetical protein HPY58_02190 [Firmicutes bacterium]|nr:hypothetical protein [Bacillota bacterium]